MAYFVYCRRMANEIIKTNVCIIGAGPSGATTSLFLAKQKIPHVIVDTAVFPRDKVCGDGLDLKVLRVLNHLDPSVVEREIINNDNFIKAWGCSIIISKNKRHDLGIDKSKASDKDYPFFLVSKRAYFDNFLVSKIDPAYADFRQGMKVKKLTREGDEWRISAQQNSTEIEIHAKMIVGADGDHSAVLRSLGERKIDRQHYGGALRQYWKGISGIHPNQHLEIYLPKTLPLAYFWIFPLPNGEANVGCGLVSEYIAKQSLDLKKLFHQLITEDPALAERFKNATPLEKPVGWGLPLASQRRSASGDGYLLIGDAAALVCPTTGEGIGPGMMSGYIAAHYVQRAVNENRYDKTRFANYDREINRRLQSDIKKYNLLRKVNPRLYNSIINFLSEVGVAGYYFNKHVNNWITTAKKGKIEIDMN
ncbi:MAG: NAD(P)/FAD-dependent oxidoreductase [Chitinophagaceae bacterium]